MAVPVQFATGKLIFLAKVLALIEEREKIPLADSALFCRWQARQRYLVENFLVICRSDKLKYGTVLVHI